MKSIERTQARMLRESGESVKDIAKQLSVSKGSVSMWVRDIQLSVAQMDTLKRKQHAQYVIEKRRASRVRNAHLQRRIIIDRAKREVQSLSRKELFILGVGLFWAEGTKKSKGTLSFSNSDPRMVSVMMKFFREIMCIENSRFRGHITLHPHLSTTAAVRYWSSVSGIPREQFYKTTQQHNIASRHKRDTLPYGTFNIHVNRLSEFLTMLGWIEGLSERAT